MHAIGWSVRIHYYVFSTVCIFLFSHPGCGWCVPECFCLHQWRTADCHLPKNSVGRDLEKRVGLYKKKKNRWKAEELVEQLCNELTKGLTLLQFKRIQCRLDHQVLPSQPAYASMSACEVERSACGSILTWWTTISNNPQPERPEGNVSNYCLNHISFSNYPCMDSFQ